MDDVWLDRQSIRALGSVATTPVVVSVLSLGTVLVILGFIYA